MSMIHSHRRLRKQLVPSLLLTGKEDIPEQGVLLLFLELPEWEVLG